MLSRLFSPPLRTDTGLRMSSPRKRNAPSRFRSSGTSAVGDDGLHLLDHGPVARPRVRLLLRVPGEGHARAPDHRPGVGRLAPGEDPEQGALARAVGAHHHEALPAPELEADLREHRSARVRLGERVGGEHEPAGLGGRGEREPHALHDRGHLDALEALEPVHPALHEARLRGVVAEPPDERLDPGDLLLLQPVALHDRRELPAPHLLVVRVGAREHRHPGHPDLRHPGHRDVEEVPVVGHHEHAAGVAVQELLEPGARLQVEVVGRLVEQEDVRALPGWSGRARCASATPPRSRRSPCPRRRGRSRDRRAPARPVRRGGGTAKPRAARRSRRAGPGGRPSRGSRRRARTGALRCPATRRRAPCPRRTRSPPPRAACGPRERRRSAARTRCGCRARGPPCRSRGQRGRP